MIRDHRRLVSIALVSLVFSGLLVGQYSDEVLAAAKRTVTKVVTTVKKSVPQKKKVAKKPSKKQNKKQVATVKRPTLPSRPLSDEIPDVILPPTDRFDAPAPLIFVVDPQTHTESASTSTTATSTPMEQPASLSTIPIEPSVPSSTPPALQKTLPSTPVHEEPFIVRMPKPAVTLLTREGIVHWTNIQRTQAQTPMPPLSGNAKLDAVAQARLDDLFAKQYFEHVSPDGTSAKDNAQSLGYSYILIGENLALGEFGTDEKVVAAWMQSPGHRANILNTKYSELGVAAKGGLYKGEQTWIAVQIFGLPLDSCPSPDQEIKTKITDSERAVAEMKTVIAWKKQDLESRGVPTTQTAVDAYNALVSEHNTIVEQMNALIANIKLWMTAYNEQVAIFNDCLKNASPHESSAGH